MNSFMKKVLGKVKSKFNCKKGVETVEMIVIIIVMLVIIAGVVLPQIYDFSNTSFDGADKKVEEIWNYKK